MTNAVICQAIIPKTAIFAAIADRDESEVVLDPDHLTKLEFTPVGGGLKC